MPLMCVSVCFSACVSVCVSCLCVCVHTRYTYVYATPCCQSVSFFVSQGWSSSKLTSGIAFMFCLWVCDVCLNFCAGEGVRACDVCVVCLFVWLIFERMGSATPVCDVCVLGCVYVFFVSVCCVFKRQSYCGAGTVWIQLSLFIPPSTQTRIPMTFLLTAETSGSSAPCNTQCVLILVCVLILLYMQAHGCHWVTDEVVRSRTNCPVSLHEEGEKVFSGQRGWRRGWSIGRRSLGDWKNQGLAWQ